MKWFLETCNKRPVFSILLLSGLVGFYIGASHATWQWAVDVGQTLAGIVNYPINNSYYMYHVKSFTLINHVSALLFRIIPLERVVTIIVSGLLGMVSFQAIAMLIFAVNRNIWLSLLGAIFIYLLNCVGVAIAYQIHLAGHPFTHGVLGLSFIVLVIALIGAGAYRPGLFLLGLAPAIHASLASWLYLIIFISMFFQWDYAKRIIGKYYSYFVAGLLVTGALLIYQLYLARDLPAKNSEMNYQYLLGYMKYWDLHRRKVYWNYTTQRLQIFNQTILFCAYSIVAGLLGLRYFKKNESLSFMFRTIASSGVLVLIIGIFTHIPAENTPMLFLRWMPQRFFNFNSITLTALLLGILTNKENMRYRINCYIFILVLIFAFFPYSFSKIQVLISLPIALIWLACLSQKNILSAITKKIPFLLKENKVGYAKTIIFAMAIFLAVNFVNRDMTVRYWPHLLKERLEDRTNDAFYAKVSQREGLMLTTMDFYFITLKTRRPLLCCAWDVSTLSIAPESSATLNNILKKVYGVDFLTPPPRGHQNKEGYLLPLDIYKDLWEKRTVREWQAIREEFGVRDVLTAADWRLALPVVIKDKKGILYEIPDK